MHKLTAGNGQRKRAGDMKNHKIIKRIIICVLLLIFITSIGFNIYFLFFDKVCYLQNPEEIYTMEAGILRNNLEFAAGEDVEITYDFSREEYTVLITDYQIDKIAGTGTELEQALNLMNEFAPRLQHDSYYDNHIEVNGLALLEFSLDKKSHGINCRAKAQILNEMCLALGIYSRKVWIMPNSGYDNDCHVVNEVWDTSLNKWVMLDITNNQYWVDEEGTPLSILEIRQKGAMQEFCTPVVPGENLNNLEKLKQAHLAEFLYIMKNLTYMEYCDSYSVGEAEMQYLLFPENLKTNYEYLISEEAVSGPPAGFSESKTD